MRITKSLFFLALPVILLGYTAIGQTRSSTPVIVDAATAATPASQPAAHSPATATAGSVDETIKLLEQMKAANQDILKRQQAALQQLEELQKAAEQLKIFSKRG